VRDLADRILELLRDRDKAHAMGGRALARREYNLEITVERYKAVYDELVKC